MSPHAWTEDQLVEQPAVDIFSAMGWQTMSAMEETFGAGGTLTTNGEQFVERKLMTREEKPRRVSLGVMLRQPRNFPRPAAAFREDGFGGVRVVIPPAWTYCQCRQDLRMSRRIGSSDRVGRGCFMGPIGPVRPMNPVGSVDSAGSGAAFIPDACGGTNSLRKASTQHMYHPHWYGNFFHQ